MVIIDDDTDDDIVLVTNTTLAALRAAADGNDDYRPPIWLTAVLVVAGVILGFLVGTRSRQIVNAVKKVPQGIMSLKELFKASEKDKDDDGGDNEPVDEGEGEEEEKDLLEKCLNTDIDGGLDDHPDVVRNPIILYQVKQSKDAARLEKRRLTMISEGMDEDEVDEILANEVSGAGGNIGAGEGRQNSLQLLISVGARTKPAAGAGGADAQAADERRRAARTIEVYLQKERGIEVKRTVRQKGPSGKPPVGPLEVALKTQKEPYGGSYAKRTSVAAETAKYGRAQLKKMQVERQRLGLEFIPSVPKRGSASAMPMLTEDMQAGLLKELEEELQVGGVDDDEFKDDEEDEEGEEGGQESEDPEEDLAA